MVDHLCSCDRVRFKTDPAQWFAHQLLFAFNPPALGVIPWLDMVALLLAFFLFAVVDSGHVYWVVSFVTGRCVLRLHSRGLILLG